MYCLSLAIIYSSRLHLVRLLFQYPKLNRVVRAGEFFGEDTVSNSSYN